MAKADAEDALAADTERDAEGAGDEVDAIADAELLVRATALLAENAEPVAVVDDHERVLVRRGMVPMKHQKDLLGVLWSQPVMPIYEGTSQIQAFMAMKDTLGGIIKNPQKSCGPRERQRRSLRRLLYTTVSTWSEDIQCALRLLTPAQACSLG